MTTSKRWLTALLCALSGCGGDDAFDAAVDATGDDANEVGPLDAAAACRSVAPPSPAPPGLCTARVLAGSGAELQAGDDGVGGTILPDGRRVTRVGTFIELPGFPMTVRPVPGSPYAIVSDGGVRTELLSVVDLDRGVVVDQRSFRTHPSEALFLGVAVSRDGRHVFASGGGASVVWAYDFDVVTGQLSDRPPIPLADEVRDGYVSGIRLLSDDRTLVANLMFGAALVLWDTVSGMEIRRIPLPDEGYLPYDLVVTPDDATAFVSVWNAAAVLPVNLDTGEVGRPIPVGKNPEGVALSPDGATLVVADSDSDSLSILDVGLRERTARVFLAGERALRGSAPSAGTFDASGERFYVVASGDNAIDVFETSSWTRLGRVPTTWYPTDVATLPDGRLLSLAGKHEGTGANRNPQDDSILDLVGGSLAVVAPDELSDTELARYALEVAANNGRPTRFVEVDCPEGADDFPVPPPGHGGPSPVIRHVVLVVRENKTYDAYFGDLRDEGGAPHGDGDPTLTLLPPDEIEDVLPNTRRLARTFALGDNYYSMAEQSVQGHIRTTWGRSTDFIERSWLSTWGRGYWRVPPQGIRDPLGYPEEGSAFDFFASHGVSVGNFGELVSSRRVRPHPRYPGWIYTLNVSDEERARWLARRWLEDCALDAFSYVLLPNDHTFGLTPGRPSPKAMMADNDYGLGLLIDAISHSTFWPHTVVFVIEDDPQTGGDHVDNHRAPLLVISPWVKRGYVSSVHYDEASIYRTIQLILGIDAPLNQGWAHAAPMLDLFTSTPDNTPYDAVERRWPEETNGGEGAMAAESLSWDWSRPDEQPGLGRMLWRALRGSDPPWPIAREELLEALEDELEGSELGGP